MLNKETILLHIQIYCLLGKKAIQNLKHKTHYSTIVRVGYVCFCVSLCVIVKERERERERERAHCACGGPSKYMAHRL